MNSLSYEQDHKFTKKLLSTYNKLKIGNVITIHDCLLSNRQIHTYSKHIIKHIQDINEGEFIYIPICFRFQKLGDEKHKLCFLITKRNDNILLELFDSNSWNYMLEDDKFKNKRNLTRILNYVNNHINHLDIILYNYSLNTVGGYCITFTLLFLLYRLSNVSINEIKNKFSFYQTRVNVNYEKVINKYIKSNEIDINIYDDVINLLIKNEDKLKILNKSNTPLFCS